MEKDNNNLDEKDSKKENHLTYIIHYVDSFFTDCSVCFEYQDKEGDEMLVLLLLNTILIELTTLICNTT